MFSYNHALNFCSCSELYSCNPLQVRLGHAIELIADEKEVLTPHPPTHPFYSYSPLQIMISTVCTALFLYPHIGFIMEVKKGIMTRETYPREEFSCCCVTARV